MFTHSWVIFAILTLLLATNGNNGPSMKTYRARKYQDKRRPHLKFVVNFKKNGKRVRSFFENKKAAETFAQLKNNELLIGETAGAKELAAFGKTVADAIEFYLPHLKASNRTCTFRELIAGLLPAKAADGVSAPYLKDLQCRLGQFANTFGDRPVCEIRTDEIDDWLRGLNVSPVTRNNSRRVLRTAFSFAKARGYCVENPASSSAEAKEIEGTVGILTVAETARLLEAADAELIPFIAIGAFAGLRRAELERLDWSEVDLETGLITVQAVKAKSARRRFVKIHPNLATWLAPYAAHRGLVTPGNCRNMLEATRARAGIAHWPCNAMRHSFASYHLAYFKNAAALALELGHTDEGLVFHHYREIVKPKDAERYWNLVPSADASSSSSKVVSIAGAATK
jgi:integrase